MADSGNLKKTKVCFVCPKAYPLFNPQAEGVFGGAEVDLYLLATELANDDRFEVSCITADFGQPIEGKVENVKIIKSVDFGQNLLTGAVKIWKAMKKADSFVYMMKTPSPGVPLVAAFCKLYKRRFAYRAASEREFNGVYLSEHPFLGRIFMRSLRQAAIITVQNPIDAENLNFMTNLNASVIPNGHRLSLLETIPKKIVLWAGRSVQIKRPELFTELAQKFPSEKFTMICQRATGDINYESFVEKARQIPNLDFHEKVPFAEIDDYFQKAKVFVNTSDSEGFPNTFIQACKAATPILSLNVNPDGFLDKYNCGICAGGDMQKMVDSLEQMLSDERYIEIGKNGREYVEQTHDIVKITERYKEIFEAL